VLQNSQPTNRTFLHPVKTIGNIPALFVLMTEKSDNARIHELCCLIAVEQDKQNFLKLVDELNRLLEFDDQRLKRVRLDDQRLNEKKGK
jgi:hypothetical protein